MPVLQAAGLRLTGWRDTDAAAVLDMAADPQSRAWSPSMRPLRTTEDVSAWLADRRGPDRMEWAVRDPVTDELVGRVGLHRIDPGDRSAEIGYSVVASRRRQGVARRAIATVLDHAFGPLGLVRVSLRHAVGNEASCAVASSAGFALEGVERSSLDHGDGVLHDTHRHARLATDPPGPLPRPSGIEHVELAAGHWLLRPPRLAEATDALAMLTDAAVAQWNPAPAVVDIASAQTWVSSGRDWSSGDHATFTVVEPGSDRLMGNVSLHRIDHEHLTGSVGYRVAPWARGRGLATAALTAVAGWSFESLRLARLEVCHAVANAASCRVAEKSGFRLEGTLRQAMVWGDGLRHDEHVHARLATDPGPPT